MEKELRDRLHDAAYESLRIIEDTDFGPADIMLAVRRAEELEAEVTRLRDLAEADLPARSEEP